MSYYTKPETGDYAEYFEGYLEHLAGDGRDILVILQAQADQLEKGLKQISENKADYFYAPGKWSVKEILGHLIDMERMFAFRALWLARGAENEQPGVDENLWAANSNAGLRPLQDLLEEYLTMRRSHLQLFRSFDDAVLKRRGNVDGHSTTVNSLPWLMAAHEGHHFMVLGDRYGILFPGTGV